MRSPASGIRCLSFGTAVVLTLATLSLLLPRIVMAIEFETEIVASQVQSIGEINRVAIGESGEIHVAFTLELSGTGESLHHGVRSSGVWTIERADSADSRWQRVSLDLSSAGESVLAYMAIRPERRAYVTPRDGGSWPAETVPQPPSGYSAAMALDSNGDPHVVLEGSATDLKYWSKVGGVWSESLISPGARDGAIVLDAQDVPHVAFLDLNVDGPDDQVKYATLDDNGFWIIEDVSIPSSSGNTMKLHIRLDHEGVPHILHSGHIFLEGGRPDGADLGFWSRAGGTWQYEDIDADLDLLMTDGADFVFGPAGEPHLVVAERGDADDNGEASANYVTKVGGLWQKTRIEHLGYAAVTPWGVSIDLDPDNQPVVAYQSRRDGIRHLVVATVNTTSGVSEPPVPANVVAISKLLTPYPNPASVSLGVPWSMTESGDVQLSVRDAAGRHVANIWSGSVGAGTHVRTWDGRLSDGRDAPSGVYFIGLQFGDEQISRRIVLSR